jgi:hypothetical protein
VYVAVEVNIHIHIHIIIIILNSEFIFSQKLKESPNRSNNNRNYSLNNTRSPSNRSFNRHPICNECVIQPNLPMLDLKDNNKLDLPPTYEQVMNVGNKT